MPIYKGSLKTGAAYKGSTSLSRIYKGAYLVFEAFKTLIAEGVPPITVLNALAKVLLGYRVYGNSKQGDLPDVYTQVEYLETDGNAYISLNETATIDCEMGLDCYAIHSQGNQFYMGCRKAGCAAIVGTQPKLVYQFGNMSSSLFSATLVLNKRHKIVANNTGCYVDDTLYYSYSGSMSVVESTNHIKLFATSQAGDFAEFKAGNGFRVYSAYVKKKGLYTVNLVPCYRDSDSEAGMYDLVTGTFYTNAGTGTFTVGPTMPNPDTPIEIESVGDLVTDSQDEHYGEYKIPVNVKGKNLFDGELELGTINSQGANVDSTSNIRSVNYIPVTPSTEYTISVENNSDIALRYYDNNKEFVSYLTSRATPLTFTVPSGAYYVRFVNINNTNTSTKIQIEEGSTPTAYEEYFNRTENIYLDEPLRKIGNYADYIDYENQKVVRNVEVIDDTGTLPIEQSLRGLTTPTEETVTLPDILLNTGTNIVSVNTSVQPSNMWIKYKEKA